MEKSAILDSSIKKYAHLETEEICRRFGTSKDGLTDDRIEKMREKYGKNCFEENQSDSICRRLRRAFINPFNVILFVLGIISLVTDGLLASNFSRNATTGVIIFSMIFIGSLIRLIQELRAGNAARKLDRLVHDRVTVRRNGKLTEIDIRELVVGDIVLISAGDRIPADMRLTKVSDLFVSQGAITGESTILEKNSAVVGYEGAEALVQLDNLVFMATTVISGKAEGIVLAVGRETLYGSFKAPESAHRNSFEKGASSIAWVMIRFMAILIPAVFLLLGITGGRWPESFLFSLSIAVGLMPEMLPMVITACLAKGSLAMSRKQTIIKDINAMQEFGSMDILCMDKTGTLTHENILLEYYMDVLGNENTEVLDRAFLNSACHSGVRNPIDSAVLACRSMKGRETHFSDLLLEYSKVDEIPFDYTRKLVSTLIKNENGCSLIVKGDVKQVLDRCSHIAYKGRLLSMEGDRLQSASAVVDEMLQDGMKVIAVACKEMKNQISITAEDEQDLNLIGYLAFFDAPKPTAKASAEALQKLKVTPKILTGDHADTAASVCRRVGIEADRMLTGRELNGMSDWELSDAVEQIHVFAELTPAQKVRIVEALRDKGHTVGFLGDGINDIPALREANVGISVDTAVDAAKDAADVVLLQKDLGVLEQGVLEGRKTFANMLKYVKITAGSNFGNIFAVVCASAFLPFLPMTSVQILLLNLLYDILCIVLPWDNVDREELQRPKDWSGKSLGRFMLHFGPISSLFDIVTFLFLYYVLCPAMCGGMTYYDLTEPVLQARYISLFQTGWFLESLWTQVLVLYFLRTNRLPIVQSRPSAPFACITFIGIVAFTLLTFTDSASLYGLTRLPVWYFGFLTAAAVAYMIFTTVMKSVYQKKHDQII